MNPDEKQNPVISSAGQMQPSATPYYILEEIIRRKRRELVDLEELAEVLRYTNFSARVEDMIRIGILQAYR